MARLFLATTFLFLLAVAARAEVVGPDDPRELETFLDGLLPALMKSYRVPGATFAMVKDGELFFAKGYGVADVESRRPVDPDETIFRLASVSKLITATAAMQLVEQGKLDLHADVNTYLEGFEIEEAYGEPVTLHHLLTHTAGFDDRFLRSSLPIGAPRPALGDYLADRLPPRVMPPGEVHSYSNHGLALVGHLVERASGLTFEEYVQRHVFDPLGMEKSRFFLADPLPDSLAVPYVWKNGRHEEMGYDQTLLGPAAELNSTATDMAKFMIAHLQLGAFGDERILAEETARLMHARHFTHHPKMSGWCYGFSEGHLNAVRTIGHGGDWRGFRTALVLVPESQLGFFVSLNGAFEGPLWGDFIGAFADRYAPMPHPAKLDPPGDFADRAAEYTGTYVPNRRMRSTILKLGQFALHGVISANEDGTLTLSPPAGDPTHWVETERDLFRKVDGQRRAHFIRDDAGTVVRVAFDSFALDRLSVPRSPRLHALLGGIGALLFLGTLLGWLVGGLARMFAGAAPSPVTTGARIVGTLVCALQLVGLGGVAMSLSMSLSGANFFDLFVEVPTSSKVLLALPLLSVPFALALPVFAVRGFSGGPAPLARLHYWLLTFFAFLFLGGAWYWKLLGFHY